MTSLTPPGLTVDLKAVVANWRLLSGMAGAADCAAVVKADAYGMGAARIAPALWNAGCRTFFVATLPEAMALRFLIPEATILLLHGVPSGRAAEIAEARLVPVLSTHADVAHWQEQNGPCWLHIDTGMNRLGFGEGEWPHPWPAQVQGILSHLACADEPAHFANVEQLRKFRIAHKSFPGLKTSLAASSGIFLGPQYHGDMVRPGIALYGGNPTPGQKNPMHAVAHYMARVLQVREVPAGETVGYGASWMTDRPTLVATIEAGYSEGLMRSLSGRGEAVVHGIRVPIIGRVSMDLITLDVSKAPHTKSGDLVELLGATLTVDEVATAAGTISYEILTSLKPRGGRHYM